MLLVDPGKMELKFGPATMGRMTTEVRGLPKSVTPYNWKVSGQIAVSFTEI